MTRDEAFAQGFRLAWRYCYLTTLVTIGSLLALTALGRFWEQVEIANAVQRAAQ